MTQTDPLLQPFQLKHLTLKNRILNTSHESSYAEDANPSCAINSITKKRRKIDLPLFHAA